MFFLWGTLADSIGRVYSTIIVHNWKIKVVIKKFHCSLKVSCLSGAGFGRTSIWKGEDARQNFWLNPNRRLNWVQTSFFFILNPFSPSQLWTFNFSLRNTYKIRHLVIRKCRLIKQSKLLKIKSVFDWDSQRNIFNCPFIPTLHILNFNV